MLQPIMSSQPYLSQKWNTSMGILGTGMLGTRRKGFLMIVTLDREGREVSYDPQIFEFLIFPVNVVPRQEMLILAKPGSPTSAVLHLESLSLSCPVIQFPSSFSLLPTALWISPMIRKKFSRAVGQKWIWKIKNSASRSQISDSLMISSLVSWFRTYGKETWSVGRNTRWEQMVGTENQEAKVFWP